MVNDDAAETVPLLEEELRVEKQSVATGKVQVRTVVESVEEIARAELDEEQVEVTRVHVGREVTTAPEVRTEGDVVIVPVLEEVLVVEKRLVLKEELQTQGRNALAPITLDTELVQRSAAEALANVRDGHDAGAVFTAENIVEELMGLSLEGIRAIPLAARTP